MAVQVFITFGCYMETRGKLLNVTNRDSLTSKELEHITCEVAYREAYELAEGWVGSHGFCEDEDGEALEDYHEELEGHLEYSAELYDPEEHDGWKIGDSLDEEDIEI